MSVTSTSPSSFSESHRAPFFHRAWGVATVFAFAAMLDALESDWASAILGDMAKVKQYDHGFTMNCRVVYAAESQAIYPLSVSGAGSACSARTVCSNRCSNTLKSPSHPRSASRPMTISISPLRSTATQGSWPTT